MTHHRPKRTVTLEKLMAGSGHRTFICIWEISQIASDSLLYILIKQHYADASTVLDFCRAMPSKK